MDFFQAPALGATVLQAQIAATDGQIMPDQIAAIEFRQFAEVNHE